NKLLKKMYLDQLAPYALTLKDPYRLARKGRWRHLRKHLLYKLTALLINRLTFPTHKPTLEILLGDDSETDAEIYLLYQALVRHEVPHDLFQTKLQNFRATIEESTFLHELLEAQSNIKTPIRRIYIHRTQKRPLPTHFELSPQIFFADDSWQIALDATLQDWLTLPQLQHISTLFTNQEKKLSILQAQQRRLFQPNVQKQLEQLLPKIDDPSSKERT
ncbi:MAG: hypothetical protein AAGJ35_04010, partial [Myxococcota bacterium]